MQYFFGAVTTGTTVPLINALGIGWYFTICTHFPSVLDGINAWWLTLNTVAFTNLLGGIIVLYIARFHPDRGR